MQERADVADFEASGELLANICNILFEKLRRYLSIQQLIRDNDDCEEEEKSDERTDRAPRFAFDPGYSESDKKDQSYDSQVYDIQTYINMSGGLPIVLGRVKIMKYMNNLKVLQFIERVTEAVKAD